MGDKWIIVGSQGCRKVARSDVSSAPWLIAPSSTSHAGVVPPEEARDDPPPRHPDDRSVGGGIGRCHEGQLRGRLLRCRTPAKRRLHTGGSESAMMGSWKDRQRCNAYHRSNTCSWAPEDHLSVCRRDIVYSQSMALLYHLLRHVLMLGEVAFGSYALGKRAARRASAHARRDKP